MTTRLEKIEKAATGLMELIDDLGERSLLIEPDVRGTYRQRIRALSMSLALPPETAPVLVEGWIDPYDLGWFHQSLRPMTVYASRVSGTEPVAIVARSSASASPPKGTPPEPCPTCQARRMDAAEDHDDGCPTIPAPPSPRESAATSNHEEK